MADRFSPDSPSPDPTSSCPSCQGRKPPDTELCETCAALERGDPFGLRPERGDT